MEKIPTYYAGVKKNSDGTDDYSEAVILYPQDSLSTVQRSDADLQKRRAELDAIWETSQKAIKEKEKNKNIERAVELVMRDSGFRIHLSIHRDLSPQGTAGFQNLETRLHDGRPPYFLISKIKNNFRQTFNLSGAFDFDEELKKRKIEEVLDISYHQVDEYEDVIIAGKAGFLGLGRTESRTERKYTGKTRPVLHREYVSDGRNEPLLDFVYYVKPDEWRDYSGRRGQMLFVQITMPESSGMQLAEIIKKDPVLIRELVGRLMKDKLLINPSAWETPQGDGDPLRPPYESWDESGVGEHLHIQSAI